MSTERKERISALDMPDVPMGQLHPHLQRQQLTCSVLQMPPHIQKAFNTRVLMLQWVSTKAYVWIISSIFKIDVVNCDPKKEDAIVFDMIGIDVSLANAFRRILISKLPAVAIEKSYGEQYIISP